MLAEALEFLAYLAEPVATLGGKNRQRYLAAVVVLVGLGVAIWIIVLATR